MLLQPFPPVPPSSATPAPVSAEPVWVSPGDVVDAPRRSAPPLQIEDVRTPGQTLPDSPVSRLQPRTVGQLLDGGFEVMRFRFRTLAIVAVTLVLPLYVVPQVIAIVSGTRPAIDSTASDPFSGSSTFVFGAGGSGQDSSVALISWIASLGLMIAAMLLGVGITHLVTSWLMGRDPSAADTLRFVLRRSPTAMGAFVLALALKVLSALAACIGLLFMVPLLSVLAPVVAAEGLGPATSVRRTMKLCQRRLGPVMGVSLLWALTSGLIGMGVQAAALVAGTLIGDADSALGTITQAAGVATAVVLLVVQVSVTVLVYIDLRVRTEGLDLRLESNEKFRAATR